VREVSDLEQRIEELEKRVTELEGQVLEQLNLEEIGRKIVKRLKGGFK